MTTVAYKDGVMAADSMITNGSEKSFGVDKIFRAGEWVVAFAGSYGDGQVVREWLVEQAASRTKPDWLCPDDYPEDMDLDVLIVTKDGAVFELDSKGRVVPVPSGIAAIGSGAKYAIGAMSYGASAEKAVEVAIRHDAFSGGEINAVKTQRLEVVR